MRWGRWNDSQRVVISGKWNKGGRARGNCARIWQSSSLFGGIYERNRGAKMYVVYGQKINKGNG